MSLLRTPLESFGVIVDGIYDYAVVMLDARGAITSWNPAAARMHGYRTEEIVGRPFDVLYPASERRDGAPARHLEAAARDGGCRHVGWRRSRLDTWFWAVIEVVALRDGDGDNPPSGYCTITRDASEERRVEDALRRERNRARATLGAVGDAVLSTDRHGSVDYMNRCAEHLTGWTHSDAFGRPAAEVLALEHDRLPAGRDPTTPEHPAWGLLPATLCHVDGGRCTVDGTTTAIRAADGAVDGWVAVFRDVTQSHASLTRLAHDAAHDPLTGLANRAEFDRRLSRTLDRMRDSIATGAVLYLDLDRFKAVNDSGGHGAGDALLAGLARAYAEHIRERDTLARLGGDEFALIVERCTPAEADTIAAKLVEVTAAYAVRYREREFGVGVSVGVAMIDAATPSSDEAVRLADHACYASKHRRLARGPANGRGYRPI